MRMLFACRPGIGHFQPLVALARAAERRGHVVAFATGEPTAACARAAGFACHAAGLDAADSMARLAQLGISIHRLPPSETRGVGFGRWFAEVEAPPRLADLDRLCAQLRPDILVHEVAELATPLAATTAGVPWVTVGFGPLLQPDIAVRAADGLAPLWRDRGLPVPRWGGLYEHLYVDPYPPALQLADIDALPATIRMRPAAGTARAARPDRSGPPCVYLTFGTVWNSGPVAVERMRAAVAGAADTGAEVIVTLGSNNDPALLDPLPENVRAHGFVPQDELLPGCTCVVAHGGSGTLLGALSWGLPLLLLPQFADQFYNAEQATRAGVALALQPAEASRAAIADAVRRLLDEPAFTKRAVAVHAELAAMPDVDAVVDRIEALLAAPGQRRVSVQ